MLETVEEKIAKLREMLQDLQEEVAPINANIDQLDLGKSTGYIMLLRDMKELGSDIEKVANISLPAVNERAIKCMDAVGMQSGDIEYNGRSYRVTPDVKLRVSVNKENKPAFILWMKQHERGKEYIKEDIHPASLQSFVEKEMHDHGAEKPPFISAMIEPVLTIRKLPGKKV